MPFSNVAYRLDLPACRALLDFNYLPLTPKGGPS
jgi:hypothetical protein